MTFLGGAPCFTGTRVPVATLFELLRHTADAGFDALPATDRSMQHQHNPATLPLAVV